MLPWTGSEGDAFHSQRIDKGKDSKFALPRQRFAESAVGELSKACAQYTGATLVLLVQQHALGQRCLG